MTKHPHRSRGLHQVEIRGRRRARSLRKSLTEQLSWDRAIFTLMLLACVGSAFSAMCNRKAIENLQAEVALVGSPLFTDHGLAILEKAVRLGLRAEMREMDRERAE